MEKEKYQRLREEVLKITVLNIKESKDILNKVRQEYNYDLNTFDIVGCIQKNELEKDFKNSINNRLQKQENLKNQIAIDTLIKKEMVATDNRLLTKENIDYLIKSKNSERVQKIRKEFSKTKEGFKVINLVDNLKVLKKEVEVIDKKFYKKKNKKRDDYER